MSTNFFLKGGIVFVNVTHVPKKCINNRCTTKFNILSGYLCNNHIYLEIEIVQLSPEGALCPFTITNLSFLQSPDFIINSSLHQ